MKIVNYFLIVLIFVSINACKEESSETQPTPEFPISFSLNEELFEAPSDECSALFLLPFHEVKVYIKSQDSLAKLGISLISADYIDWWSYPQGLEGMTFPVDEEGKHSLYSSITFFNKNDGFPGLEPYTNYRLVNGSLYFKEVTKETISLTFSGDVKKVDIQNFQVSGDVITTITDGKVIRVPYDKQVY